jgi:HK97 family phage portal protein
MGAQFGGSAFWAENLAAVTSAVTIISRTIGSLPALVYQQTGEGRVEVDDHAVVRLLRRPDGGDGIMTWPDFVEWWVASALLAGNGLAAIEDDGQGAPIRLRPVPWWAANPLINPNSGRVGFQVSVSDLPWWPSFAPVSFSSSDSLWLRDRTDSGVLGRSALSRAPQVLQLASEAQGFASATFGQGAKLSGALKHPGKLGKEAVDNLSARWRETHSGPANASKVVILEEGMDFAPMAMTLEDAELLASRKFNAEEIARLFNIPLPILNIWDHSTFTNSDTASQWFGQLTLAPWCRKIEAEAGRVLFNDPSFHLELDLSALMRGSFSSRIQSEINLVRAGILTVNEVRLAEGYAALPGGDVLQAQAVGGRPTGTGDGEGDQLPQPGSKLNGSGQPALQ